MTRPPDAVATLAPLSPRQVQVAFGGLLLGMLLGALDQTILATALPTIVGELGAVQQLSWVVGAYLLTSTVSIPLWGKLGDLYGRTRLFQVALVVFVVGSALCGAAGSIGLLIAFRAGQGLGAGGLFTLAMAIVGDLVAPRERGRYQGYIQAMFALASIAGPLMGGSIIDHLGWRWIFYVNLPLGAVALAVIGSSVRLPVERRPHAIDYLGAALLAAAVTCLLLVLVWGGSALAWTAPGTLGLAAVALGLGAAFIVWERRAAEPVLPLHLLQSRVVLTSSATLFCSTCAFFGAIVFVPVFLQVVRGDSATGSGLRLLPMLLASTISAAGTGRIISWSGRYKWFPVGGLALMAASLWQFAQLERATDPLVTEALLALFGLGFGMVGEVLILAVQNAVDSRDLGTATGAANLLRALGGCVGVAIYGAIFNTQLRTSPVFVAAALVASLGCGLALLLEERPLRTAPPSASQPARQPPIVRSTSLKFEQEHHA